jgi:hypothetical protein
VVGVDADVGRDVQAALDDLARRQVGIVEQRARCRLGVGPARPDRDQAVLGLDHVAVAGDHEGVLVVRHCQQRLQPAQRAVGAPVLREFHRRPHHVSGVLLQHALEAFEQRERVGGSAGEAGQDAVMVDAPDLARVALHHRVPERHLPIAAERDLAIATDADDGGSAKLLQRQSSCARTARVH